MSDEPVPEVQAQGGGARASDAQVIEATDAWLRRVVIGLNLCPFARAPYTQQRVRMRVSRAQTEEELLVDLGEELLALQTTAPLVCETTLLIHPDVLSDFFEYNDFLEIADACLRELRLEGELQVASFHPDYQFADTTANAIENHTNCSPYPMLHLLREASVERAVESIADPDEIYRRNIETLRKIGLDGLRALGRTEDGSG